MDEDFVLARVRRGTARRAAAARLRTAAAARGTERRTSPAGGAAGPAAAGPGRKAGGRSGGPDEAYDPGDPVIQVEREALKLAIQRPVLCGPAFDAIGPDAFTAPRHATVKELVAACGGTGGAGNAQQWAALLRERAPEDKTRAFVTQLAVEPLRVPRADGEPDARYADAVLARLEELAVSRSIAAVKSRLQRLNPVDGQATYNRTFGDLVALEQRRKALLEKAAGAL